MAAVHVDVQAPQAEFTQLRTPDVAAKCYWTTSIFEGSPLTFRVVDDAEMTPVDGTVYLNARLQEMHKQLQNACVHRAAELAYRSLFVEISLLDDPLAVPGAADCAVDLWLPLHVALMTGNKSAVQTLLQFHVEHAVDAMTCFANTPSKVRTEKEMEGTATSEDSPVQLRIGLDVGEAEADNVRGSVGEAASAAAAAAPTALTGFTLGDPILECQVRRELGGAVVLLGHFDGRIRYSSSAAVRKSRAPSPVRSAGDNSASSVPTPVNGINNNDANVNSAAPPVLLGPAEDLLVQSVMEYNEELLKEENSLFEERGEEYCLMNVLTALRPLLQSVVLEIERRWQGALPRSKKTPLPFPADVAEPAVDLLRDFCVSLSGLPQHPPLLVDNNLLFDLCHHGDLTLLSKVLDVFEGALAPVLRGQALLTDRHNGGSGNSTAGGMPTTPKLHVAASASRDPSPHLSSFSAAPGSLLAASCISTNSTAAHRPLAQVRSSHSVTGTPRGGSIGHHLCHPPTPTSFWWSCRPQQVHQLAFTALWIGCRESVEESSGSGRRRRAVSISTENRVMMATVRQLVESRVAAQKLSSMIWSGHLVTIAKLLSRDCTLEDFIDFVEEGGYFNFAASSGFSGPFLSVLVSGVMVAAAVRDAATVRVLRHKVETLLADVPGRSSPLRSYVMGKALTHTERFSELWLDAGSNRGDDGGGTSPADGTSMRASRLPHKFRTRVELLYYAVVEQVLEAAEEAWTQEPEDGPAGAAPTSLWVSGSTKEEAQAALQNWLLMWTNFFTGLRDRPDHRRSPSFSSTSSQVSRGEQQQQSNNSSTDGPFSKEKKNKPRPQPPAAPSIHDVMTTTADDVLGDDTNEVVETVRRMCRALISRLETGNAPLPALHRALYPNGVNDADGGASGSATPAQVDKALPMSSIDQDFTSATRAFGDMAAKESQEVQLKFYGLYKQATKGDVDVSRPGFFDYAGRAKWDAWSKLKGMSLLDAKRAYVNEYKMMIDLRKSNK
ncbi:putative acyl-CoA binding protein [Leptomonas pyrrhocoris]|uniref:Putative acyl-CoA binding protein n=1 Tax=Leptomonas pyrrhocoris TaxID=157538 RepID=A0A0M9FWT8_LEPPY|nr:putative acyl-CoA binding protein [Leptomonas pyrrhocoris]KPA77579.1 putative acyl-CoA binding protein [Leptomonas pyrrhocoris]|eukprot:XP_015656018.1 putative acyl-CoA binding protein [Leptomonas pyrrhocoris]